MNQPLSNSPEEPLQVANGELQAECERLRQTVKALQEERQKDQEMLTALQAECDQYRRMLLDLARAQFTDEELKTIPAEKDCAPLDEFLAELERIVQKS